MSGNVKEEKSRSTPWRAQQDAGRETRCPESSQDWGLCWENDYLSVWQASEITLRGISLKNLLKRENVSFLNMKRVEQQK